MNSPFRYAGGKFYARKLILNHIPPHKYYIEAFAGGASIFFAKPKVETNQLNDLDPELVNTYNIIKNYPERLISFLSKDNPKIPNCLLNGSSEKILPASKEIHSFFKNTFIPQNNIERAGRWYYLNRTSYSGIMKHENMYWGYGDKFSMQPKNWASSILRTSEKLHDVILTCKDFEEVIDCAPDNSLVFIDPPYFNADQSKFYTCNFSLNDHYRLAECIKRNKERLYLFLTYDNSEEIRKMYNWMMEIHDKEWNYCIQRTDDQKNKMKRKGSRYKGKELFILNYSLAKVSDQLKFDYSYLSPTG